MEDRGFYRPRLADTILKDKLEAKGAVVIRGPKWCGKTTTAEQFAKSVLYVDQPAEWETVIRLAEINPSVLLQGPTPRLLDEWQLVPSLWDAVRYEVDHRRVPGQFILTGSAVPENRDSGQIRHSGVGRFSIIQMYTMTLFESGDSSGSVSLGNLFDTPRHIEGISQLQLQDIAFFCCRGGWPYAINNGLSRKAALSQAVDYLDIVVEEDISRVDGIKRDTERVRTLLRSYARFQGTQTPVSKIREDLKSNNNEKISDDTINSYLNALRQIYVIKDMTAWNPNLKSKAAIRTTPTRYFIDPSIATAALRIGPDDLMKDLKAFGFIFETLCVRDLRVYAESLDGDVYHFRDSNGLECDAVIHLRNGRFGLVEIKLGGDKLIEEGVRNLKKLEQVLDESKVGSPSFLMILTAVGQFAYRREDGVYVVPISCLRN